MLSINFYLIAILIVYFIFYVNCVNEKDSKIKINKNILDYNNVDMEKLFDQWEENDDDKLDPDELPHHLKPSPKIDLSNLNLKDPEEILKLTKKDKTLMMFVNVNNNLEKSEVDQISGLWQTSLLNNHLIAERYLIDNNRIIFMFKDGSQAWEAKNFLIEQKQVIDVTIENKSYPGKFSGVKDEL